MHMNKPPYAHNDMKPGNVLLSLQPNNKPPQAVIMDFGSASIAQKQIRSHSEALALQVHTLLIYLCNVRSQKASRSSTLPKPCNFIAVSCDSRLNLLKTQPWQLPLFCRYTNNCAVNLQEWAAKHCSAPYRAPELWDCASECDIDERTDVWSLGCTLFAIM